MSTGDQPRLLSFTLLPSEQLEFELWKAEQKKKSNEGATIGGRWTFIFTPTGLGTLITVKDNETGDELKLADSSNW